MGHLNNFSTTIKNRLTALQASGAPAFVEVVEHPTNEFPGYPAATVTPREVASEFITVAQNQRSYGFTLDLYYTLDGNDWAAAFAVMRDLVDLVLDDLDRSIDLDGVCDFLKAAPMEWTIQPAGQGLVLSVEIVLAVIKDIDVR